MTVFRSRWFSFIIIFFVIFAILFSFPASNAFALEAASTTVLAAAILGFISYCGLSTTFENLDVPTSANDIASLWFAFLEEQQLDVIVTVSDIVMSNGWMRISNPVAVLFGDFCSWIISEYSVPDTSTPIPIVEYTYTNLNGVVIRPVVAPISWSGTYFDVTPYSVDVQRVIDTDFGASGYYLSDKSGALSLYNPNNVVIKSPNNSSALNTFVFPPNRASVWVINQYGALAFCDAVEYNSSTWRFFVASSQFNTTSYVSPFSDYVVGSSSIFVAIDNSVSSAIANVKAALALSAAHDIYLGLSGVLTDVEDRSDVGAVSVGVIGDAIAGSLDVVAEISDFAVDVFDPTIPSTDGISGGFGSNLLGFFNGFNFGSIWHYVTDWLACFSSGLSFFTQTIFSVLPSCMITPLWACVVIAIIVGLYRRFLG